MKLTRSQLRQMILKEFRDTIFNDDDKDNVISPPGGFHGMGEDRSGGKGEAILKIYLDEASDNVLKTIYGGTSEASVKRAIDRAIQEFERILAELELTYGIAGMKPDDFPDTMGPTNPIDIDRQQTLLNYCNYDYVVQNRGPGPFNSWKDGPINLLLNIQDENDWGRIAMMYIVENYPHMRVDGWS